MDNFETTLMLNKIEFQKDSRELIKDIVTIKNQYYSDLDLLKDNSIYIPTCNTYKCFTLAISRYITKCSSPLPVSIYRAKYNMEQKILSKEFLSNNELTYKWLIDTFQYAADIPINTPNNKYAKFKNKQVIVEYNMNYTILNKLALLVKDRTIPFTIDFNSKVTDYYEHLTSNMFGPSQNLMKELVFIQTLKTKADNNITYTLFEEALNERLKKLSIFEPSLNFIKIKKSLNEFIKTIENLNLKYIEYS